MKHQYNGVGELVGTKYPEPDVMWFLHGTTAGDYPDLDRFNRVTSSRWTKDLATDVDFYDVDLTYDRNGNITQAIDNVHEGFDVIYTMDDLNRLTRAQEGTESSGSITSETRDKTWTLDQVGNWDGVTFDLNDDDAYGGTDEFDEARTHNVVNELTARDTDNDSTDDVTLAFDAIGNMTDDGEDYEYEYDPLGRLRKVNDTDDQSLVAEYRYNALGYRIGVHEDTDSNGEVDSNDKWFYSVYDLSHRVLATYREADGDPKAQFIYHASGWGERPGGPYAQVSAIRDRDADTTWDSTADGVLEERIYLGHDARSHVCVVISDDGDRLHEWVRYMAFGIPIGVPGSDSNSSLGVDSNDETQLQAWIDASAYDVRGDSDLDGDVDVHDKSRVAAEYFGLSLGRGTLSQVGLSNKRGFYGSSHEVSLAGSRQLRGAPALYDSILGRATQRNAVAASYTSRFNAFRRRGDGMEGGGLAYSTSAGREARSVPGNAGSLKCKPCKVDPDKQSASDFANGCFVQVSPAIGAVRNGRCEKTGINVARVIGGGFVQVKCKAKSPCHVDIWWFFYFEGQCSHYSLELGDRGAPPEWVLNNVSTAGHTSVTPGIIRDDVSVKCGKRRIRELSVSGIVPGGGSADAKASVTIKCGKCLGSVMFGHGAPL